MTYTPYEEPRWLAPEVTRREYDGHWLVWVWLPAPQQPEADSLQLYTKAWQIGAVFGSKPQAARWAKRWVERRKR